MKLEIVNCKGWFSLHVEGIAFSPELMDYRLAVAGDSDFEFTGMKKISDRDYRIFYKSEFPNCDFAAHVIFGVFIECCYPPSKRVQ